MQDFKAGELQVAIFGAGCFWSVEEEFRKMEGIMATEVGYSGGRTRNPSYEAVCTGITGHAEVVRIIYDPSRVSYEELLQYFWRMHDPTTPNRQGWDIGEQYRSVIFFHTPEQEQAARTLMDQLDRSGKFANPIVTEIKPAEEFWRAEEYHQKYVSKKSVSS